MSKTKKLWWKTLTCLALALTMSLTLFIAACGKKAGDNTGEDTDSPSTVVDTNVIKNGSFEFVDFSKDDDGNDKIIFPVTSVNNWSRSTTAALSGGDSNPVSNYDSGIIDISKQEDKYLSFKKEEEKQIENLKALNLTARPGAKEDESKVLMIANNYKDDNDGLGTAQKFTSNTTLDLTYGYAYKISVWVRTAAIKEGVVTNLLGYDGNAASGDAGAYIGVNGKLNSQAVAPTYITNIDTNGNWQEYSLYIKASDFASNSVNVVVGLGIGGKDNVAGYVEGYAFFDDISYEIIPVEKQSAEDTSAYNAQDGLNILTPFDLAGANLKVLDDSNYTRVIAQSALNPIDANKYAIKIDYSALIYGNGFDGLVDEVDYKIKLSKSDDGLITAPDRLENANVSKIDTVNNFIAADEDGAKPYQSFFENYPFDKTGSVLVLRAKYASAYTFTLNNDIKLEKNEYSAISFFVKTTKINSGIGATLTLIDKGVAGTEEEDFTKNSFSAIDTTTYIKEDQDDYYDGWKKFTFLVKNDASDDSDVYYSLQLNFGLTSQSEDANQYNSGWAAFANFTTSPISAGLYDQATGSEFVKKVAITNNDEKLQEVEFDQVMAGDKYLPGEVEKIKTHAVLPANYRGITGGTKITGYDADPSHDHYKNPDVVSGLMDTEYIAQYNANGFDGLIEESKFVVTGTTPYPGKFLGVYNTAQTTYGYISKNATTVAANSYAYISVDVLVLDNAKAYIYLTSNDYNKNYKIYDIVRPKVDGSDVYTTEESGTMYQTVSASSEWQTVLFVIATGDEAKTFNVEFWNGSRDGLQKSQGLVLFNNLMLNKTMTQEYYTANIESTSLNTDGAIKFTRQPDVFYNEEYGANELASEQEEQIVYLNDASAKKLFVNYQTIDVTVEKPVEDTDDDTTDTTPKANKANIWVLLSSILFSLVLIATLVLVGVRKLKNRVIKKRVSSTTRYRSKKKHYAKNDISKELDIIDDEALQESNQAIDAPDQKDDIEDDQDKEI